MSLESPTPAAPDRIVVLGAGAIGASMGALLHETGTNVTLVARGAHGAALERHGLDLRLPGGPRRIRVPCVQRVEGLGLGASDLVLLAVMGQHTAASIRAVPPEVPVVSLQNGTGPLDTIAAAGHPLIAGLVFIPAERRAPGVVALSGAPDPGMILLGGWGACPSELGGAAWLADRLTMAGVRSGVDGDIGPWIRAKLLANLAGIVAAVCDEDATDVYEAAQAEARAVWRAAGLPWRSVAALLERVGTLRAVEVDGRPRIGGSTRHALRRGQPLETASLHDPIRELGRRVGVQTPVNDALVELATRAHAEGWRPGCFSAQRLRGWVDPRRWAVRHSAWEGRYVALLNP